MSVCCATVEECRTVYIFLQANALQFHTFTKEEGTRQASNLRRDVESDPDEVADKFHQLGFPAKECIRLFTTYGPRRKLPLLRMIM